VKLIVGLGNPGSSYAGTRHNVGFWVIDRLAGRHGVPVSARDYRSRVGRGVIDGQRVTLLKPQTYMNLSGEAVGRARRDLRLDPPDVLVVYDEVDLPPGRIRVRADGGAAGHRGVSSIIEALGGKDFARIRVGIGRPGAAKVSPDYVTGKPTAEERQVLEEAVERAADAVEVWLREGVHEAMNRFNGV
jgi:PTH1 family peptidyl-tRNA hydrolase